MVGKISILPSKYNKTSNKGLVVYDIACNSHKLQIILFEKILSTLGYIFWFTYLSGDVILFYYFYIKYLVTGNKGPEVRGGEICSYLTYFALGSSQCYSK